MNGILKTAACATFAFGLAVSGAALGQQADKAKDPAAKDAGASGLEIGNPDPTPAMDALLEAVNELRQATVIMLDKEKSAEREKAVNAALEAIADAQQAMIMLPRAYRVDKGEAREATDWPMAAGRLSNATQELETAIKALKTAKEGEDRDKAIKAMRDSLEKAQDAMAALPDWDAGKK